MIERYARAASAARQLASAAVVGAALSLALPAQAEPTRKHINDRIAELCTASDVDLVGKRLARRCRAEVRARWMEERQAAAPPAARAKTRVALGR